MTNKLLRNQRIRFLLVLWAISYTCSGQSSNATAQSAPGIKTGTSLNSLSRMASVEVQEAEKVQHFVVWRVPLPVDGPTTSLAPDGKSYVVNLPISGRLEDVAYLVVNENPEDSHGGEVLWYRTAYVGYPQLAPFVNEALSWNPQKKRIYLTEITSLCCSTRVEVYEIDPGTIYGTYPPLVIKMTSQKSSQPSRSSDPIVNFDPEERGDSFSGVEYVKALDDPNQLLISIRNIRGATVFTSHFTVDLDSQSWKRVSLK